jgi:anti-sigma factor RsiW
MMPGSERRHRHIHELIPWYVNGTLDEREMDLVTTHTAQCASCAEAVKKEVSLARRLRERPAALDDLTAMQIPALNALQTELSSSTAATPAARASRQASLRERFRLRAWQWSAAAAAVLVIVASASFVVGRASFDPTYQVMTNAADHNGVVIQLIFHPRTSEQDIRHLLADGGAVLLGNPSDRGVYRLALPADVDGKAYADRLRAHPAVRWADVELR